MTLTEFLLAQFAKDEAVARAASTTGPRWVQGAQDHLDPATGDLIEDAEPLGSVRAEGTFGETIVYDEGSPSVDEAAHIARHDPARVLAECEAKRRIVDEMGTIDAGADPEAHNALEFAVWCLALPYRDHPDFQSSWLP